MLQKEQQLIAATIFLASNQVDIDEIFNEICKEGLILQSSVLLSDLDETYPELKNSELDISTQGPVYEGLFIKTNDNRKYLEFIEKLNKKFLSHKDEVSNRFDVVFQLKDSISNMKLAVFDMDSTLIQQEVIDEIAKITRVGEEVSKITEAAMRGEINFETSLARRLQLLSGSPASIIDQVREVIIFTPGGKSLCKVLKQLDFKLAVVSGGFLPLANYVKKELGLDYAFANQLELNEDGTKLTGKSFGPIVTAERKEILLNQLASENNLSNSQAIAVGDGANDLLMIGASGLGIAFNAKPKVQLQAFARINRPSLLNVLYFLGMPNSRIISMAKNL